MSRARIVALTSLAMLAFAGNSLLNPLVAAAVLLPGLAGAVQRQRGAISCMRS